jgi:hypothetical protein
VIEDPLNILFLDFDGPMLPHRGWPIQEGTKYDKFDPIAAATVRRLCEAGVQLVISSTWREDGLRKISEVLEASGIDPKYLHQDWRTIELRMGPKSRMLEIKTWLIKHKNVHRYAILDDEKVDLPNLVHVTEHDGVLLEHQQQLFKIFSLEMK